MFGTKNHRRDTRHASDSKTKRLSFERIEPRLMLSVAPSELEVFFQDAPDEPLEGVLLLLHKGPNSVAPLQGRDWAPSVTRAIDAITADLVTVRDTLAINTASSRLLTGALGFVDLHQIPTAPEGLTNVRSYFYASAEFTSKSLGVHRFLAFDTDATESVGGRRARIHQLGNSTVIGSNLEDSTGDRVPPSIILATPIPRLSPTQPQSQPSPYLDIGEIQRSPQPLFSSSFQPSPNAASDSNFVGTGLSSQLDGRSSTGVIESSPGSYGSSRRFEFSAGVITDPLEEPLFQTEERVSLEPPGNQRASAKDVRAERKLAPRSGWPDSQKVDSDGAVTDSHRPADAQSQTSSAGRAANTPRVSIARHEAKPRLENVAINGRYIDVKHSQLSKHLPPGRSLSPDVALHVIPSTQGQDGLRRLTSGHPTMSRPVHPDPHRPPVRSILWTLPPVESGRSWRDVGDFVQEFDVDPGEAVISRRLSYVLIVACAAPLLTDVVLGPRLSKRNWREEGTQVSKALPVRLDKSVR